MDCYPFILFDVSLYLSRDWFLPFQNSLRFPHRIFRNLNCYCIDTLLNGFNGLRWGWHDNDFSNLLINLFEVALFFTKGEVIPFLILAIGVDNMFIISTAVKGSEGKNLQERIRGGMTEVGPSITAAAVSEILAFLVGTFTNIPALQAFCMQAAIAVFFDYIF